MDARKRIIFALDVPNLAAAIPYFNVFSGQIGLVKVGLELYTAEGPPVVREARDRGYDVMLDLKLHDIPETVKRAAMSAARLGPELLTVHSAGGLKMMESAVNGVTEAAKETGHLTKILAITMLTSLNGNDLRDLGFPDSLADDPLALILARARLAIKAGCHGVVAPVFATQKLRKLADSFDRPEFLIVNPGISLLGKPNPTQKATGTAEHAMSAGASNVVIGRDLRDAPDKLARLAEFVKQVERGLATRAESERIS